MINDDIRKDNIYMTKPITIPDAVRQLLSIVDLLRESYKTQKKQFTLDGRLVGDIGEVLVEDAYDIRLFEDLKKHHDATASDGRLVQIKATMQKVGRNRSSVPTNNFSFARLARISSPPVSPVLETIEVVSSLNGQLC